MDLSKYILWISWFPYTILSWIADILSYPLVPIALLFSNNGRLPIGFRWLETQDNPLIGDSGHIERWKNIRSKHPFLDHDYFQEVAWLWRNKAYRFSYEELGRIPDSNLVIKGNVNVENSGLVSQEGINYWYSENLWGLFLFKPLFKYSSTNYVYLRMYLGWKCKGYTPETKKRAMLAFNISFRLRKRIYDNDKALYY